MTRDDLITQRNALFEMVRERKRLGGFDANADAILIGLESTLRLYDHELAKLAVKKGKA